MNSSDITGKITELLTIHFRELNLISLDILMKGDTGFDTAFSKSTGSAQKIPLSAVLEKRNFTSDTVKEKFSLTLESAKGETVYCTVCPLLQNEILSGYLVFQTSSPVNESGSSVLDFFTGIWGTVSTACIEDKDNAEQYKAEVQKVRDMQARLFPKFSGIEGLDIASAYLPANYMSGNFIDGMHLDENTYQIAVCDVSRYGASSTFTGGIIRTVLKYESPKKMAPSGLIETIISRLKGAGSVNTDYLFLSIYQIKLKNGKAVMSSYGPLNTFLYNSKKGGYANLKNTDTGRLLEKRNFLKDLSLTLEEGDFLVHYSHGFNEAESADGSQVYGDARLSKSILANKDEKSMDIVHSMVEDLYEFTNYSPVSEDIILICIKKE